MNIFMKGLFRKLGTAILLNLCCFAYVFAQQVSNEIKISVTADKADWLYKFGETPIFKITATQNGKAVDNIKVFYQLGLEKLKPTKSDSVLLKKGETSIKGYSLNEPGFLRMVVTANVNGKNIKSLATAAFEPLAIKPTITLPSDFNQFWQKNIANLAKIPMDAKLEHLPGNSTANVNVYQLSLQNIDNSRVYGILCVPTKAGKYPALLRVPGAGVRSYKGDVATAERGFITLEIGIHGIPVNLPDEVYSNLREGALKRYNTYNLDSKDIFYYKRVYLGCLRALDYLASHPFYDGTNLGIRGGSQGGALAITTAALDKRVKYLVSYYPALSDLTGYLHNRAGGWPHYHLGNAAALNNTKEKLETMQYYDVVNFAKQLTIPGIYTWGFNDETCPPTSMYAAYNSITAPKELSVFKEAGHTATQEQRKLVEEWIIKKLKN